MNLGLLGTALAMGIAAIGSAIGIGIAGQASIGAWKKCYMSNKACRSLRNRCVVRTRFQHGSVRIIINTPFKGVAGMRRFFIDRGCMNMKKKMSIASHNAVLIFCINYFKKATVGN